MLPRWSKAISQFSRAYSQRNIKMGRRLCSFSYRDYSAVAPSVDHSTEKDYHSKPQVNLNKMFWSRPQSLALAPDSPLRIDEPQYEGIQRFLLKLMLFYSKQSTSIRGAHVIYRRVIHQIDRPAIYDVFSLEKTFKTTFALLVIHMWLCLRRLKQEGKEGVELGQYLYEIYNHDLELRVSKAGVNLLLTKWMKDLEKIFYGNIVAYDAAMLPEAGQDELQTVIWRNVFSDDGTSLPNDAALLPVQAICRYVCRESNCLSLTDKDAVFSGNFTFTSLENTKADKEGN
ncbi:uncharacterized protein LOC107818650 [Nicotiana tabacum]|uniref:uncharacterized protein LOC107818650 n=1 Tax=Nicotiana tabacum TaxID=4097 RepID=UPI003F4EB1C0